MITMNDIARFAGVSKATVSNVLSKKKKVSDDVANTVLEVCRKYNYHPNKAASSLVTKKTNIIGLFLANRMDFFKSCHSDLIKGIVYTASEYDYKVLIDLCSHENDEQKYNSLLSQAEPTDGYIIHLPKMNDERITEMLNKNIAFVVVGSPSYINNKNMLYVDVNNGDLSYKTTKHLLELGHKHIGFLNSMPNATISFDRLKGYVSALDEYGIEFDPSLVYNTDNTAATGIPICNVMLTSKPYITAIITCSDDVAAGVYEILHERGYRIPEDISVIALGGDDYGEKLIPKLTTAVVDYRLLGKRAVELLLKKINNEEISDNSVIINIKILEGNSTGPAKMVL